VHFTCEFIGFSSILKRESGDFLNDLWEKKFEECNKNKQIYRSF
jgi:hypothetical protein